MRILEYKMPCNEKDILKNYWHLEKRKKKSLGILDRDLSRSKMYTSRLHRSGNVGRRQHCIRNAFSAYTTYDLRRTSFE